VSAGSIIHKRATVWRAVLFGFDNSPYRVRPIVLSPVSQSFRADAEPERQRDVGVEIRKRCSA
jgi:hypothetical protein